MSLRIIEIISKFLSNHLSIFSTHFFFIIFILIFFVIAIMLLTIKFLIYRFRAQINNFRKIIKKPSVIKMKFSVFAKKSIYKNLYFLKFTFLLQIKRIFFKNLKKYHEIFMNYLILLKNLFGFIILKICYVIENISVMIMKVMIY